MTVYDFAKLSCDEKMIALKMYGYFCDTFNEGKKTVNVYYLDGFYVEETVKEKKLIDVLPFKRGYKIPEKLKCIKGARNEYHQAA